MDILIGFVGKVLEITAEPIARQFSYVLSYCGNVNELENRVEKLKAARANVQHLVDAAQRNCEEIEANCQDWMHRVDDIIEKGEEFRKGESRANTRCSYSSCPNLRLRHQRSRKAKKMTAKVDQLKGEGNFDKVSIKLPPKYRWPPSIGKETLESRILKLNEIMEALGDPEVQMIGLHGLGGVGKTTLSKQVAKKAEEEKLFEMVVWVEVKDKPLTEIQSQIAYKLKLQFDNQNDNEIARANCLCQRLEQEKSLLLLLDDLWIRLDLDEVGIPFANEGNKHCKIILTSRDEDVSISQMNCKRNIRVELLSESEALRLFKEKSGVPDDIDDLDLLFTVVEVAKECAKLPIAIFIVASALRNNKNLTRWSDALLQLKRHTMQNVPGVKDQVYSSIKMSHENLASQELQSMFLLSAKLSRDLKIS